jgi:DNA-binding response OmpR family regulator
MSKKLIFVLEDDRDIRQMIQIILSNMHYEVKTYSTVHDFTHVIPMILPDMFILDVMLPDGNGIDVCAKLKANLDTSKIPVLIMSANTELYEINKAGCGNDFMAKPFDIAKLREKVQRWI